MKASRSHDEATVYLLQQDPDFAETYLHAALAEINRRVDGLLFYQYSAK